MFIGREETGIEPVGNIYGLPYIIIYPKLQAVYISLFLCRISPTKSAGHIAYLLFLLVLPFSVYWMKGSEVSSIEITSRCIIGTTL